MKTPPLLATLVITCLTACSGGNLSHKPEKLPEPGQNTVAIFAGHTTRPGNRGTPAYYYGWENVFNDTIVNYFLNPMYRNKNINYVITPSTENLSLRERCKYANNLNSKLFIGIHHDSGNSRDIKRASELGKNNPYWKEMSGFSIHYSTENCAPEKSLKFAEILGDEMLKEGFKASSYHAKGNSMLLVDKKRGIYNRIYPKGLYVLRHTSMPAVILECGFIMNPVTVKTLADPLTHQKIVKAINNALSKYFNLQ